MQKSEYGYSDEAEAAKRLLEEVDDQINSLTIHHPDSVEKAALLQYGDMMIARQAVMTLGNESERDGLLSISYAQEARIKHFFLSYGNNNTKREALNCIQKAISLLSNPYYYFIQATIHEDLGERYKAIQSLETAVDLGGSIKAEMQTELARMKGRFSLEDSRNASTNQVNAFNSSKNDILLVGNMFLKYSLISFAIIMTISFIFKILYFTDIATLFRMISYITWPGILTGLFFCIQSLFLKEE